jgi:Na+-translocating ferredoxin:NAD+ oxidoreductase RnfC subunit
MLAVKNGIDDDFGKLHLTDCMECGACSYICPAKQHPLGYIKMQKLRQLAKKVSIHK